MFGRKPSPFDALASRERRHGAAFDASRARALLARLGDPQRAVPCAHVGGTNGKGSVIAMMDAALREAGHRVGRFTSPPLVRYEDQVRLDGHDVPEKVAREFLDEALPWADAQADPPTGFEILTALAFWWWARERADVALVEVGIGGHRDATNVLDRPLATVVTNVTDDHLAIIGPTLADAAREKAGIARPGVPFLTAAEGEPLDALLAEAARLGADPLRIHGLDFEAYPIEGDLTGQSFSVRGLERDYPEEMRVALPGAHQATNAALALAALDAVDARGMRVNVDAAVRAISRVRWPGRLTHVPADGERPAVLLDGAHNPAGAAALTAFLRENDLTPTLLFGCLADKPWQEMVTTLAERAGGAVCTRPANPRALSPSEPARAFAWFGKPATVVEDPAYALATAFGQAGKDGLVLVTGSLYLVGAALDLLGVET